MATLNEQLTELQTARDNMKVALEGKGQTVTKDIRTYAEAISNISSGGSETTGIKQFATEEEMQADTTAKEGDLAVVYGFKNSNLEIGGIYDSLYLPKTIVLNTAITATTNIFFDSNTSTFMSTHWVRLTATAIQFYRKSGFTGAVMNTVKYTSSDGITYTRTDSLAEVLTVAEIYQNQYSTITVQETNFSILQQMFSAKKIHFGGLFKTKPVINYKKLKGYILNYDTVLTYTEYEETRYDSIITILKNITSSLFTELPSVMCAMALIEENNLILFVKKADLNNTMLCAKEENGTFWCKSPVYNSSYPSTEYVYTCDLTTNTFEILYTYTNTEASEVYHDTGIPVNDKKCIPIIYNLSTDACEDNASGKYARFESSSLTSYLYSDFYYDYVYELAPTQLDAEPSFVYESTFYGANGLETGTLQESKDLSSYSLKVKVEIWNTINDLRLNVYESTTMLWSGNEKIFALPNIDFSEVNSISNLCYNVPNLTTVPLFNTATITNMYRSFGNCPNLSEESLNNILAMCTNSAVTDTKTLANVGLTEEQATTCTGLSNYQAFLDAGWTTGY